MMATGLSKRINCIQASRPAGSEHHKTIYDSASIMCTQKIDLYETMYPSTITAVINFYAG